MITPSRSPALHSPSRSRRLIAGAMFSLVAMASGCAKEAEECLGAEADGGEGGYESVGVDEADVEAAAEFAVEEITGTPGSEYEVLCAQEQVVSGTNYRLGLDIDGASWLVVVYEDGETGTYELTSSEEVE
jgi:hypothetical protein